MELSPVDVLTSDLIWHKYHQLILFLDTSVEILFCVPLGYKLVGCDASGLEARCKAHFMYLWDKGEFVKIILEGNKDDGTDIHSINAKALGLSLAMLRR